MKKRIIKKAVSMIVAVCLMIGIANIPVYAGASAISAVKTTDAVLSKEYVTPSQAVKKAVKSSAKATTKPTATKKATAKKAVKKTVSLTSQIISKYTKKGLTALKAVANKLGFSLKTTYEQFVRYGVTKADMKKVSNTLIKLVNKGVKFTCCATLAVSKYLGISNNFSALQCVAATVAHNAKNFSKINVDKTNVLGYGCSITVLQKNGKKAEYYEVSLKDFMNNLKKGQKALFYVTCYNPKGKPVAGHELTVVKEKDGKYGVFDTLLNGGEKVIYTKAEFKKLMCGKSAKGKTSSGITTVKPVYFTNTSSGVIRYEFIYNGKVSITTDSKNIANVVTKKSKEYKSTISLVNKLLKKKGLSSLAKTWLKKAKKLINNIAYSNKKSASAKEDWLNKAYSALKTISEQKFSILSLVQQSTSGSFSSLKSVLKKDLTYKNYTKYGEEGIKLISTILKLISTISKKYKLKEKDVYNAFVKSGTTKDQMETNYYVLKTQMEKGNDIFIFTENWVNAPKSTKKSLAEIKKLLNK